MHEKTYNGIFVIGYMRNINRLWGNNIRRRERRQSDGAGRKYILF